MIESFGKRVGLLALLKLDIKKCYFEFKAAREERFFSVKDELPNWITRSLCLGCENKNLKSECYPKKPSKFFHWDPRRNVAFEFGLVSRGGPTQSTGEKAP